MQLRQQSLYGKVISAIARAEEEHSARLANRDVRGTTFVLPTRPNCVNVNIDSTDERSVERTIRQLGVDGYAAERRGDILEVSCVQDQTVVHQAKHELRQVMQA